MDITSLPEDDRKWTEDDWGTLLQHLIKEKIVNVKDVTALVLGHINPPQVGTSIASNKNFQKHYEKRKTWSNVVEWFYNQSGVCQDCGTMLELQADHIIPKEQIGAEAADRLDNITLRCRRCNVVKRPSHAKGGLTFLTAESALMWLLFVKRPKNYEEFAGLCRTYGLTMASIRFQEAWAMAKWLEKKGQYVITDDNVTEVAVPQTIIPEHPEDDMTTLPQDSPPSL
ncbi:MAG: HNH endonuclease signature motif containing protein [Bacteroidota bacterium]